MLSCCRITLAIFNLFILIFSIVFLALSVHFFHRASAVSSGCDRNYDVMVLWTSLFTTVVSVMGIVGACCKIKVVESLYLWVLLVTTVVTISFATFIFTALPHKSAGMIWEKTANGNWLDSYSSSLQTALVNEKDWHDTRRCLMHIRFCDRRRNQTEVSNSKLRHYFHFVELGCCRPPKRCGLVENNSTTRLWEVPKSGVASGDEECEMWGAKTDGECYECASCKAGHIAQFQQDWERSRYLHILIIIFLLLASVVSCRAFRSDDALLQYQKHGQSA